MPKRTCIFTTELEEEFPFIEKRPYKGDPISGVFCKLCNKGFSVAHGGRSNITQHLSTKSHKENVIASSTSKQVPNFFTKKTATKTELILAAKEATFSFHTVLHDHSFRSMDCTTKLIQSFFETKFTSSRTKCQAIVTNVLAVEELKELSNTLQSNEVHFICLSVDTSGHGATKILPIIVRYFLKSEGVKTKLLDVHSIPGETSEIILNHLLMSLKNEIKMKVIALCADNTNTNFGGCNRNGTENVFYKFKGNMNKNIIGIGCGAHIIHNSVQSASDNLPVDVECVIIKIYKYFSIYTVRTETLKEFCEFTNVDYKKLLGSSGTRWLSLGMAVERLLQVYEGVKSYFLSQSSCPIYIKKFLSNPISECYLWFIQSQLYTFNQTLTKVQYKNISASEVGVLLLKLKSTLQSRKDEKFIGMQTKTLLKKLSEDGLADEKVFYNCVDNFYETAIEYLAQWSEPYQDLLRFSWIHLNKTPIWEEVENSVALFNTYTSEKINESALFDELLCVKEYVIESKVSEWNNHEKGTFKAIDERWIEIASHFHNQNIACVNVIKIVEFALSLSGTNATIERVFSLMNNTWTPEKAQLQVDTLKAILVMKTNVNMNCKEYYEKIKGNEDLLKNVHSKGKYN